MLMQNFFAMGLHRGAVGRSSASRLAFGRLRQRRASSATSTSSACATSAQVRADGHGADHPVRPLLRLPDDVRRHHPGADHRRHRRPPQVRRPTRCSSASGWSSSTRPSPTGCSAGGWLAQLGALDFAGGAVVHINAGAAALAVVLVLGRRRGLAPRGHARPTRCPSPCSAPASCGSAGSASTPARRSRANGVAAQAVMNTFLAASAGHARLARHRAGQGRARPPPSAPRRERWPAWWPSPRAPAT